MEKIREDRRTGAEAEARGQSIILSQGFWNALKKLSVAGDEAVRDAGASPSESLAKQANEPVLVPELIESHQGTLYREGDNCHSSGGAEGKDLTRSPACNW